MTTVAAVGQERLWKTFRGQPVLALLGTGKGGGVFLVGAADACWPNWIEVQLQTTAFGDLVIRRGRFSTALDAIRRPCE
jgi:hypothetical protein